jgi:hypothetical protein
MCLLKTHDKDGLFAVRFALAHDKHAVRFMWAYDKVFFKNVVSELLLIVPPLNIILSSIFQLCNHIYLFANFKEFLSLKGFFSYKSNLNCKCIK